MKSFNRARWIVAILCVLAFVALVLILGHRTPPQGPVNGDQLGMDNDESFSSYLDRADASLAVLDADSEEESFALVAFDRSLTPEEAGEVLQDVGRVNAAIIGIAAPRALPEPIEGEDRADVFQRELDHIAHSLGGIGDVPTPETINAVVVWDTPATLRALHDEAQVASVEALPPDATWGLIGISPVFVDAQEGTVTGAG